MNTRPSVYKELLFFLVLFYLESFDVLFEQFKSCHNKFIGNVLQKVLFLNVNFI